MSKTEHRPEPDFSVEVCQPCLMEGGDHGVLLLHGFTGSAAHMRLIAEGLHRRGFTVQLVNLPGHATTMADMGKTTWQHWLDYARDAFRHLQERCKYASVVGLSMGGCISLLIAEQMHPTAIVPVSAPMAVQNKMLPLARFAAPFLPMVWWQTRDSFDFPVIRQYDYGYPGFPTHLGGDLHRLIRMARRDLHAVQCPVLVVQSHGDQVISPDSADVILRGVSSPKAGVLWLDSVPHVCTISHEHERITEAIAKHLKEAETQA